MSKYGVFSGFFWSRSVMHRYIDLGMIWVFVEYFHCMRDSLKPRESSSREKLYQKLGLKYLHHKYWMTCSCFFYKVISNKVPKYIHDLSLTHN